VASPRELTFRFARQPEYEAVRRMIMEVATDNLPYARTNPCTMSEVTQEMDEQWTRYFAPFAPKGLIRFLLALAGEEMVGISVLGPRQLDQKGTPGFIYALGVKRGWRRQGIGRGLLKESMQRLRAMGYAQVSLAVYVNNSAARELYRREGFVPEQMTVIRDLEPEEQG
jgi:ribosomal protein S18 acetylase RimI-like enzyme